MKKNAVTTPNVQKNVTWSRKQEAVFLKLKLYLYTIQILPKTQNQE